MGYQHINNLDRDTRILEFRRCFALEKVHGTSSHISWRAPVINTDPEHPIQESGKLGFFAGGAEYESFIVLFDHEKLTAAFQSLGQAEVTVYGEAYGGKEQGMSKTYGPALRFIAFEVKIGESWLAVPQAAEVIASLGLEFVHWEEVSTDIDVLDALRQAPSVQAVRNGVTSPEKCREGIVLRPPFECTANNGDRIMAKFKADWASETKTPRKPHDVTAEQTDANKLADEWVTPMRCQHILSGFGEVELKRVPEFIKLMWDDILRESAGEVEDTPANRKAVCRAAAVLYKEREKSIARERLSEAMR